MDSLTITKAVSCIVSKKTKHQRSFVFTHKTNKRMSLPTNSSRCGDGKSSDVKVMIRVRPMITREIDTKRIVDVTGPTTLKVRDGETSSFECAFKERILDSTCTQEDVFRRVSDCVDSTMDGFNATIFAYGQTGSGKTYTLFGKEGLPLDRTPDAYRRFLGITPRAIHRIFEKRAKGTRVNVSFLQVYNENLFDLLLDARMSKKLTIHEDKVHGGMHVEGISVHTISSASECLKLLQIGNENRITRETRMNQFSSRSHSIFQLVLERAETDPCRKETVTVRSKLNLVDLAGSEKWDLRSRLVDAHIHELTNINLSLHTLGRCIEALTSKIKSNRRRFVPYRDSVLTRLLQDSLGGNTRTCLIATISPSIVSAMETVSTLKFADRAKNVSMTLKINRVRKIDLALVERLESEIRHLRGIIETLGGGTEASEVDTKVHKRSSPSSPRHRQIVLPSLSGRCLI